MDTQRPQAGPDVKQWPGMLQWNSEIHRRWGRSSLHFWLLRFREMYDREEIFAELTELMDEARIGAYAAYELSGEFDILLRAWIPVVEAGGFADRLEEAFRPVHSRVFTVQQVVRHWPWRDEETEKPRKCDLEALAEAVSADDIATINRLADQTHRGEVALTSTADAELVQRLMEVNAVADLQTTTGIRVLVRLKVKERIDNEDWLAMTNEVAGKLDRITRPKGERRAASEDDQFTIDEVSLYRCNDRSLLILCRVPYTHWHLMRERLLEPLTDMPGVLQTTTLPALSRSFVKSRNCLLLGEEAASVLSTTPTPQGPSANSSEADGAPIPPPPSIPPSVRRYLEKPESAKFEVKGSAFSPLVPWLCRPMHAKPESGLKESSAFFRDTIARTVVGMLNTEGGVIVIGALEKDRFAKHKDERLQMRLSQLPATELFCVLGLNDPTFLRDKWDGFDLKFNRLLKESIHGEVADLVRIHRDLNDRQTLALVQIEHPCMTDGFWLRDGKESRFLIRRGGSTDELQGPDAQRYIDRKRESDRRRLER